MSVFLSLCPSVCPSTKNFDICSYLINRLCKCFQTLNTVSRGEYLVTCLKIGCLKWFFHTILSFFFCLTYTIFKIWKKLFFARNIIEWAEKLFATKKVEIFENLKKIWVVGQKNSKIWKKLLCSKHHRMGGKMICNEKSRNF